MAAEGKCIARHEGKVVFIEGVAPGDVVDVQVKRKKNSFIEASPIAFHQYSDLRKEPICSHFGVCGGCKWQHIGYEAQLDMKQQQVVDALERIAKVPIPDIQPIVGSEQTSYYRNKLEFSFSDSRWLTDTEIKSGETFDRDALGFHIPGKFDKILDVDHCYLQPEPSNSLRDTVKAYAKAKGLTFFNPREQVGNMRNLIVRTANTGQVMVIVQFGETPLEAIEGVMEHIKAKYPEITSLNYIINTKRNETFHDLEVVCYFGQNFIVEQMEGLQFRVGPKSFYQTNSAQAYQLYAITRTLAGLTGEELVYDLYTGTGTIANFVAKQAKKVIGVEFVPEAIVDAKINSQINGIDNTDFYAGDMKAVLSDDFVKTHGRPDVIITDPPRAGMHEDVIQVIMRCEPDKIVYVSCNPATQARDIALMDEKYEVKYVQPVDMFPHTHHVENVILLVRKP